MKGTLAACADRAVGFGAASLGLTLLFLTARHLFAPIPALDPPSAFVANAPAVATHAATHDVASRPMRMHGVGRIARGAVVLRSAVSLRAVPRASPVVVANAVFPRAPKIERNVAKTPLKSYATRHAVAPRVAASRTISSSVAARRSVSANVAAPRVATATAAASHGSVSATRSHVVAEAARPSASTQELAPRKHRPRARRAAFAAFRMPARFDVRPALVTMPETSVAAMPADDTLPTIVARKRRR